MEYIIYTNPGAIDYRASSHSSGYYVDQLSPKKIEVSSRKFESYIKDKYRISLRRYYNIVVMYDVNYQPHCPVCGKPVKFNRLTRGYFETCSDHCNNKLRIIRNQHNLLKGNYDWKSDAKGARTIFRMKGGKSDRCIFYICSCKDDKIKFGVTRNLNGRLSVENGLNSNAMEVDYLHPLFILKSTRYQVSEIEYRVKCFLENNHEFVSKDKLDSIINFIKENY